METNDNTELLITKTPFYMESYWELLLENDNSNCSHQQIDELIHKKIISIIDIEIMKAMASYRFFNISNLTFYLNNFNVLHKLYQKSNYGPNIKKLKKAGIIACHHFIDTSVFPETLSPQAPASPLRLYSLTPGAYSYTIPLMESAAPQIPTTTPRKLEIAVLSQFLIRFQYHYSNNIQYLSFLNTHKIGSTPFTIDAFIQYNATNILDIKDPLSIFVLSIRRYKNWRKETHNRLKMLNVWLTRHADEYHTPLILLLIEDFDMISSLYAETQIRNIIQFSIYFIPDTLLMLYSPFSCIYHCEIEDNKVILTHCSLNL